MPNIPTMLETAFNVIHSLTDDNKPQIHIGEAMACWTYLAFIEEIINYEQVGLNMTMDNELQEMLEQGLNVAQAHKEQISKFMQKEGIPLPDPPQSKSKSESNSVPAGSKFTDSELSNAISINFIIAADMLAASATQSLRTDVGLMFLQFQMDKITLGFKLKNLMKNRGWLKIPPAYIPAGLPQQS
jgi:hypothetical protein